MKKDSFQKGKIIIYKTSKNEVALDVRLEEETVWLDAHQIARLFHPAHLRTAESLLV